MLIDTDPEHTFWVGMWIAYHVPWAMSLYWLIRWGQGRRKGGVAHASHRSQRGSRGVGAGGSPDGFRGAHHSAAVTESGEGARGPLPETSESPCS